MGFIKKLIGLFSKNKAESTVANEVEDNSSLLNEVEETTPVQEEETPAVEGVVETKTETKAEKVASSTVAKLVDFKAVAKEKYNDKRKRLQVKKDDLTEKIAMAEDSISRTDDKYLVHLAEKDMQNNTKTRAKISTLLETSEEDFEEVMLHKSHIAYLNLIQKKIVELKKVEKDSLAKCSSQAREMAKGCRAILPFDTQETVKSLENNVSTEENLNLATDSVNI